jgi:hypothetical protein
MVKKRTAFHIPQNPKETESSHCITETNYILKIAIKQNIGLHTRVRLDSSNKRLLFLILKINKKISRLL